MYAFTALPMYIYVVRIREVTFAISSKWNRGHHYSRRRSSFGVPLLCVVVCRYGFVDQFNAAGYWKGLKEITHIEWVGSWLLNAHIEFDALFLKYEKI